MCKDNQKLDLSCVLWVLGAVVAVVLSVVWLQHLSHEDNARKHTSSVPTKTVAADDAGPFLSPEAEVARFANTNKNKEEVMTGAVPRAVNHVDLNSVKAQLERKLAEERQKQLQ